MFSFENLATPVVKAIAKLEYKSATAVQEKAIPVAMQGHDILVSAKTGSGKTLAFLLPMINTLLGGKKELLDTKEELLDSKIESLLPRALILLPTRELAIQTQQQCQQLTVFTSLESSLLIGGEDFKQQSKQLANNPDILIATPGRMSEHIESSSTDLSAIEIFILDEADRILEMGFKEVLFKITSACRSNSQKLFFSATLKNNLFRSLGDELLNNPKIISIDDRRSNPDNIRQLVILADDIKHKQRLVTALVTQEEDTAIIIFCNTRSQCRQLGNYLLYKKIKADLLHGDIPQSKRSDVLADFHDGYTQVLVATDVAARGLDFDDIGLVINFDCPYSAEDLLHRCGRTGRAGKVGTAITLISSMEWNLMSGIERYLRMRFERYKIEGLIASYKGPKKLKKSGKATGHKKKKKNQAKKRIRTKNKNA